ncbi:HAMP domain-containing sensor histidine kinase [Crassaminicella indica]|uniref:histidine kinase n=1 Tax=Crassaminicella indica TaxID=2855394 RepID=A0ABX8RCM7_9CLOT|nr:HAMP domain-containing sensor histidine kinase [Crassaminicella indica]QXM05470.1 HAMP domain-containing histidine kinase [Crassaminicella indica]
MLEKKPLKTQFIISFTLIIIISLLATMLTYYAGYSIYRRIEYKRLYPANYYENKIPEIEEYIRKADSFILSEEGRRSLDKIIPFEGIVYQVIDESGNKIYGTDNYDIIKSKEELYKRINTTIGTREGYAKTIPIFDSKGKMLGAVSLYYTIKPYYFNKSDKIWIIPLFIVIIFSPFIYIIIFTLFFSRKFACNIGKPVDVLIRASEKVKEKDLDFEIEYNADNELGKLCTAFDEMKNELRQSLILQWRIEHEKHDMVEALAHDLKTPFSVIQGYAESLLDSGCNDKQKIEKYLRVIEANAYKGSRLIKEMLYVSELESTDEGLRIVSMDIEAFLIGKKESYEIITKDKGIYFNVNINYENHNKKVIPVDENKLERILDNIVLNAIRFTPENGIITIDVYINSESIRFKVCDTGNGFSSEDLENGFNKFYRGDKSRSSKNGHAGLGLYIAKKLVNMHGGSIKVFNLKDVGACVEFDLYFSPNNSDTIDY